MTSPLLTTALLGSAEASLNLLLQQDPPSLARLRSMEGEVILLHFTQPHFQVFLLPTAEGIDLMHHSERPVSLTLRGSALDFLQLAQSDTPQTQLFGKGITLEGNQTLASALSRLLREFKLDWEAWLGDLVGDTAAHPIAQWLRRQQRWSRRAAHSLTLNTTEYLQEEARLLPPRTEVEIFFDEVETLRDDVERLAARLQALRQR